ncbi:MAG: SusC/RagA family TonB-linked outer membrane protein, partial [Hymenobacter sp.]
MPIRASITPSLQQTFIRTQSLTLNSKINYERTFGQHNLSAFVAYEQNQTRADNFLARRNGFESPQIDQLFAGSQTNQVTNGSASQGARQNYFGRVSYGYQDKYLAQVYFRYDGSQIFPEGRRFGFFPGASLGWRISEESFLKNNPVVSNLKLRASLGQLGNDRVAQYQFLNIFTFGNGYVINGQDVLALNPGVAANPNITWEKQTNLDIGIEAGFFKNRLTFEGDFFYNKRTDILAARNVTVPQYTGLTLPSENIGRVDNRGFDAQLTYRTSWHGARFNISGNVTYARNKVVFIDEGNVFRESYQKLEGQPLGSLLVYDVTGIYQTSDQLTTIPGLAGSRVGDLIYRDVNGDGVVNSDDRIRLDRNATPQLQYGLNLGAEFKGFDLTALFQGQAQAVQEITYNFSLGSNGPDYFLANAWTPTNTGASLPRIGRSKLTNNLWVRDVSFVRLKNVELGYTLPRTLLSKVGVQTLRFYVNGYNLLTFDSLKKDGLPDPENVNIQGGGFVSGISYSPAQQDLVYARTDVGGAYRWQASTRSWVPITDNISRDDSNYQGIRSIAPDPSDPNRVYLAAGTYTQSWAGTAAILASNDQGATWTRSLLAIKLGGNENGRGSGEPLQVDPNLGTTLYLGSSTDGLWRSTDRSATWSKVASFPVASTAVGSNGISFVVFDKSSSATGAATKTIYVGVLRTGADNLYKSTDGGATWAAVAGAPTTLMAHHAAVAADGTLYLAYCNGPGPNDVTAGDVLKYVPGTGTWTSIKPTLTAAQTQGGYGGLSLDPQKPGTILVSTIDR